MPDGHRQSILRLRIKYAMHQRLEHQKSVPEGIFVMNASVMKASVMNASVMNAKLR